MRPSGSPEELERRRVRAIGLLRGGHAPVEVARMLGVDRRSVRRWNAGYRRAGASGLKAKRELERALLKGAMAAGFATDLWTCPRVARLLRDRFGVNYHVDHVGRLLHALGWSPQKPERRAVERNEADIQRWIRETWPRVKKTPRG